MQLIDLGITPGLHTYPRLLLFTALRSTITVVRDL